MRGLGVRGIADCPQTLWIAACEGQTSSHRLRTTSAGTPQRLRALRNPTSAILRKGMVSLAMLALVTTACTAGLGGATNQRDNAVRRVALAHELQLRGPADEVLVDFGFLDWRDNLGFSGRRTVWLNPIARDEFFAERDASRTYIYLRSPIQQGEEIAMQVERGSSSGVQLHQLTLRHESGAWKVVADVAQP